MLLFGADVRGKQLVLRSARFGFLLRTLLVLELAVCWLGWLLVIAVVHFLLGFGLLSPGSKVADLRELHQLVRKLFGVHGCSTCAMLLALVCWLLRYPLLDQLAWLLSVGLGLELQVRSSPLHRQVSFLHE